MSNGAHNDGFPWRDRLEGLKSLPGEAVMDKAAAWEKLGSRLQGKKRRRYAAWYWSAAAVALLAVLLVPAIRMHQQKDVAVALQPAITAVPPAPAKVIRPALVQQDRAPQNRNIVKKEHRAIL